MKHFIQIPRIEIFYMLASRTECLHCALGHQYEYFLFFSCWWRESISSVFRYVRQKAFHLTCIPLEFLLKFLAVFRMNIGEKYMCTLFGHFNGNASADILSGSGDKNVFSDNSLLPVISFYCGAFSSQKVCPRSLACILRV